MLKKRFVLIFQDIFGKHPIFKKVEVFTKFPEKDRPKHALLVRSVSGSSQKLGLDNFVRTARQYSILANLKGVPGNSIEWVRDDTKNIDKLSAPGFYIVKMVEDNAFTVSPFLLVDDEKLEIINIGPSQGAVLKNVPVNPDSEIIFDKGGYQLKPGIDYTITSETGEIIFKTNPFDFGDELFCDYQVIVDESEPYDVEIYTCNNIAIPGVLLAFGDRLQQGDEQVVVIEKEPRDVAKVYGGRWQLSVDLIGISQDDDQQERLVDYAVSLFWAEWQDRLVNEGINVYDFSLSGESEDMEVETPEEYYYTGGISFTAETDWELHVPLISEIRRINLHYGEEGYKMTLPDDIEARYEDKQFDERMIPGSGHQAGLVVSQDPQVMQPSPYRVKTLKYPPA